MSVKRHIGPLVIGAIFIINGIVGGGTLAYAADFTGKRIVDISISDNTNVAENSIIGAMKLKAGDDFNDAAIQQDLQAIYALGNFYDVQANFIEVPAGIKVVYSVVEKTAVKDIVVKGNTKVSSEKLKSLVEGVKDNIVDNKTIKEKSKVIEQYYHDQGYILAKVNDMSIDKNGVMTIYINEGNVEGMIVKGNEKTKINVVTREII